jgi:hypothetical protein
MNIEHVGNPSVECRKTSFSTFSGRSGACSTEIIFPAELISDSDGTDVLTILRYLREAFGKLGNIYILLYCPPT